MRKLLSLALALLIGTVVLAQTATHDNATEKKASDEITLKKDTKIGTHILKAGRYKIVCDTKIITFSLITEDVGMGQFTSMKKVLEVPCDGKLLADKHTYTETSLPAGQDGVPVLEKLTLRGGNVEHVFPSQF